MPLKGVAVEQVKKDHWFWQNWVLLGFMAALCFASCNLMVGGLTSQGLGSVLYFNTGSLLFTSAYFIKRFTCDSAPVNYGPLGWVFFAAFLQVIILWCVTLTFATSQLAGLNPGIACTIWNVGPFFSALGDKVIYK